MSRGVKAKTRNIHAAIRILDYHGQRLTLHDYFFAKSIDIEGVEVAIDRYFLNHPEMVLDTWSRKDTPYADEGYSVLGNSDLAS
jgi:hypothetical protein